MERRREEEKRHKKVSKKLAELMGVDDYDYKDVVKELGQCRMLIGRLRKAKTIEGQRNLERNIERRCEDIAFKIDNLSYGQRGCINVAEYFADADRWIVNMQKLYDFNETIEIYNVIETYYKEGMQALDEEYGSEEKMTEREMEEAKEAAKARLKKLMKH